MDAQFVPPSFWVVVSAVVSVLFPVSVPAVFSSAVVGFRPVSDVPGSGEAGSLSVPSPTMPFSSPPA